MGIERPNPPAMCTKCCKGYEQHLSDYCITYREGEGSCEATSAEDMGGMIAVGVGAKRKRPASQSSLRIRLGRDLCSQQRRLYSRAISMLRGRQQELAVRIDNEKQT